MRDRVQRFARTGNLWILREIPEVSLANDGTERRFCCTTKDLEQAGLPRTFRPTMPILSRAATTNDAS